MRHRTDKPKMNTSNVKRSADAYTRVRFSFKKQTGHGNDTKTSDVPGPTLLTQLNEEHAIKTECGSPTISLRSRVSNYDAKLYHGFSTVNEDELVSVSQTVPLPCSSTAPKKWNIPVEAAPAKVESWLNRSRFMTATKPSLERNETSSADDERIDKVVERRGAQSSDDEDEPKMVETTSNPYKFVSKREMDEGRLPPWKRRKTATKTRRTYGKKDVPQFYRTTKPLKRSSFGGSKHSANDEPDTPSISDFRDRDTFDLLRAESPVWQRKSGTVVQRFVSDDSSSEEIDSSLPFRSSGTGTVKRGRKWRTDEATRKKTIGKPSLEDVHSHIDLISGDIDENGIVQKRYNLRQRGVPLEPVKVPETRIVSDVDTIDCDSEVTTVSYDCLPLKYSGDPSTSSSDHVEVAMTTRDVTDVASNADNEVDHPKCAITEHSANAEVETQTSVSTKSASCQTEPFVGTDIECSRCRLKFNTDDAASTKADEKPGMDDNVRFQFKERFAAVVSEINKRIDGCEDTQPLAQQVVFAFSVISEFFQTRETCLDRFPESAVCVTSDKDTNATTRNDDSVLKANDCNPTDVCGSVAGNSAANVCHNEVDDRSVAGSSVIEMCISESNGSLPSLVDPLEACTPLDMNECHVEIGSLEMRLRDFETLMSSELVEPTAKDGPAEIVEMESDGIPLQQNLALPETRPRKRKTVRGLALRPINFEPYDSTLEVSSAKENEKSDTQSALLSDGVNRKEMIDESLRKFEALNVISGNVLVQKEFGANAVVDLKMGPAASLDNTNDVCREKCTFVPQPDLLEVFANWSRDTETLDLGLSGNRRVADSAEETSERRSEEITTALDRIGHAHSALTNDEDGRLLMDSHFRPCSGMSTETEFLDTQDRERLLWEINAERENVLLLEKQVKLKELAKCFVSNSVHNSFVKEDGELSDSDLSLELPATPGERHDQFRAVVSGLRSHEVEIVRTLIEKHSGKLADSVTDTTTHVIVKTDSKMLCVRTLKFLMGVAAHCWILSYNWVIDSQKANRLLNKYSYEVLGDMCSGVHNGPRRSRLSRSALFENYEFFCPKPFIDISSVFWQTLLKMCGAHVTDSSSFCKSETRKSMILVEPSSCKPHDYESFRQRYTCNVVDRDWVIESIAVHELQSLDLYLLL